MPRVKRAKIRRTRKKKIFSLAKGFYGRRKNCLRIARIAVWRSLRHAYIGRKLRKRDLRRLWITRLNAAIRLEGLSYSRFMGMMKKAGVELNRKVLQEIALKDPEGLSQIVAFCRTF